MPCPRAPTQIVACFVIALSFCYDADPEIPRAFSHRLSNRLNGVLLGVVARKHPVVGKATASQGIRPPDRSTSTGMAKGTRGFLSAVTIDRVGAVHRQPCLYP